MSEFKGTKGKWTIDTDGDIFADNLDDGGDIICLQPEGYDLSMKNWGANSLLISKAPEILNMLRKCHFEFGRFKAEFGQGSELESEVLKLIKEATEL